MLRLPVWKKRVWYWDSNTHYILNGASRHCSVNQCGNLEAVTSTDCSYYLAAIMPFSHTSWPTSTTTTTLSQWLSTFVSRLHPSFLHMKYMKKSWHGTWEWGCGLAVRLGVGNEVGIREWGWGSWSQCMLMQVCSIFQLLTVCSGEPQWVTTQRTLHLLRQTTARPGD